MASSTINIGGDAKDISYRYKMPKLITKIEGKGNGIKTVIVNMENIAIALNRKPEYPAKFFGTELGAQSKYDDKTGHAVVNGAHNQGDLAKILEGFIEKYVLCAKCRLPETDIFIRKGNVCFDCKACGNQSEADAVHKLTTFILNHEKKTAATTTPAPSKKKKEKEKVEKEEEEEEEEIQWSLDTSKEAAEARRKEHAAALLVVEKKEKEAREKQQQLGGVVAEFFVGASITKQQLEKGTKALIDMKMTKQMQEMVVVLFADGVDRNKNTTEVVCGVLQNWVAHGVVAEEIMLDVCDKRKGVFAERCKPFLDWLQEDEEEEEEEEEEDVGVVNGKDEEEEELDIDDI